MKKLSSERERGITLVALVVTIVVLLILAGVTINLVLSDDGIFKEAEEAESKYEQSKARETLEMILTEAKIKKVENGLSEEELNERIEKVGSLLPKEDENSNNQQVVIDGYIFKIDKSVPKIINYVGPANCIIITATVSQNDDWQKPIATVTGTITKYGGGTVTSSSATAKVISTGSTSTIADFPTTGGSYTINNITEDTAITITATDNEGKTVNEQVDVKLIRDITPPTIKTVDVKSEGLKIKINATAEDDISGIKQFNYSITPTTGLDKPTGTFTQENIAEITTTEEDAVYTVIITAEDIAENKSAPESKTVRIGGVMKHIKLSDGTLKEVNTRDIYGADVTGYNCMRTGVNWQIFYIDEEDDHRVYLIAKNYMTPPTNETELKVSGSSWVYYWTSEVLDKYKTIIPNTSFTTKFLSDYANTSAVSQENLQATNYMLDQNVWSEYKSTNGKTDYAFGGPTLQLFQASYNDICNTTARLGILKVELGYQFEIGTNGWTDITNSIGGQSLQNGLYVKEHKNSPAAMFLASPTNYANALAGLDYGGSLHSIDIFWKANDCGGFRPCVALKTGVTFTENSNGTYTINK